MWLGKGVLVGGLKGRNVAISILAVLTCLTLLYAWVLMRAQYVTVISGMDSKTLSEADQKLHELKIPDRIIGRSIEVPAGQINKARIQLAIAGLPKAGTIQKQQ